MALQDVRYAADASTTSSVPITNGSTTVRNKWQELDYRGLAEALMDRSLKAALTTKRADKILEQE